MVSDDTAAINTLEVALLRACPPGQRAAFARFLQMLPSLPHTEEMRKFKAAVDDTDFPLADWAGAGAVLQTWLEARGRTALFDKKLGYLTCCAESVAMTAPALRGSLAETVAEMLDAYGFVG